MQELRSETGTLLFLSLSRRLHTKKTIGLFLACFLLFVAVHQAVAQVAVEDVIYLKSGGVMRGVILEMVPGQSVRLRSADGTIYVYQMGDVERIAREPGSGLASEDERNKMESWYLCFALGYAGTRYPSALQHDLDQISSMGTHTSVGVDLPAVYWSVGNRHTVVGGALNLVGDRYEVNSSHIEISQLTLGVSVMHFPTGEIGDGLFLRGDIGVASLNVSDSYGTSVSSDAGLGLLLGGGYAFPVSNETRLYFQGHFSARQVEGDTYRTGGITFGVML